MLKNLKKRAFSATLDAIQRFLLSKEENLIHSILPPDTSWHLIDGGEEELPKAHTRVFTYQVQAHLGLLSG